MLYDRIMVPYDGSPSARAALDEAVRFAREDPGLTLHIVHLADISSSVAAKLDERGEGTPLPASDKMLALREEASTEAAIAVRKSVDPVTKGLMNEVIIEVVEATSPGEQIVAYADEHVCDLIIMGSRGLGALRGMLGSVSSYVLRESRIPVMIVKNRD